MRRFRGRVILRFRVLVVYEFRELPKVRQDVAAEKQNTGDSVQIVSRSTRDPVYRAA